MAAAAATEVVFLRVLVDQVAAVLAHLLAQEMLERLTQAAVGVGLQMLLLMLAALEGQAL